jgi:hypothetical protein
MLYLVFRWGRYQGGESVREPTRHRVARLLSDAHEQLLAFLYIIELN